MEYPFSLSFNPEHTGKDWFPKLRKSCVALKLNQGDSLVILYTFIPCGFAPVC